MNPSDLSSPELSEGPVGPDTVGADGARAALTDSARCLTLGASLSNRLEALAGIEADIVRLGIESYPTTTSWEERTTALAASDELLADVGLSETVLRGTSRAQQRIDADALRNAQEALWGQFRLEESANRAYAWLRSMAMSSEPVVAISADVAMSHWTARKGQEVPSALQTAKNRARRATTSPDLLGRSIAESAKRPSPHKDDDDTSPAVWTGPTTEALSTIVHGTSAWAGDWWLPGGEFFEYVASDVRTNLYTAGDRFSWSGRYSQRHRDTAAERFAEWCRAKQAAQVDVLFGHSYGGCIALASTAHGVQVETVVLLSTPDHAPEVEWRNIGRCVSLRIHLDLILLAARKRQFFRTNVDEHYLPRWFVLHGDSHERDWWELGDWPRRIGLAP